MSKKSGAFLFPCFVLFSEILWKFQLFSTTLFCETAVASSVFPWKSSRGNRGAAGQNWSPHARLTFDHCVILRPSLLIMLDIMPSVHTLAATDSSYRVFSTYVVSLFRKLFLWFLTYAPRLHREGGTIFVSDQLLQGVNEAVNLRVYCQMSLHHIGINLLIFFYC